MRTKTTWLRFRSASQTHAIRGTAPDNLDLWITACGAQFNRRIGEQDVSARRCAACEAALTVPEAE